MGFKNVVRILCALHTPLKPRFLLSFPLKTSRHCQSILSSIDSIVILVWKYNDLTLKSKLTLSTLTSSFLENKYNTNSWYIYAPHIYQLCCSIGHRVNSFLLFFSLLPNSDITYWIKYFDKIKCYTDRPYLVFFSLKPETYIYFFFGLSTVEIVNNSVTPETLLYLS